MKIVLAGIIVVFVIVVGIAGVMFFNSMNPKTLGVSNPNISNDNQATGNNTTHNNNILPSTNILLPLIPYSWKYNGHSTPTPSPTPGPGPTPDPMNHVISLFDAYIKSNYNQSLMPGMAVVIVQNDKIVYMNCFGVKDLASGAPVDENTLFGIGSLSKAFTATNIAQLVSRGLMSWDDPLAKYYNNRDEFQLYSDYVTNNITVRDALTHRSGLPSADGDPEWSIFNNSYPFSLYQLRYMKNNTPFRSTYAYNNLIYALAGYCAARADNTTWSELIKEDLLNPLEMTTTVATYSDFMNSSNHATPYIILRNGTMEPYDFFADSVGPAGSIYSSVSEMANWLKFQIADTGYYNGKKIVSKKELDETRTGQIKIDDESQYGFGWIITKDTRDPTLNRIAHAGSTDAFHSAAILYPSQNLGLVILSNGGTYSSSFRNILGNKFIELLKGNDAYDPWPATKKELDASWKPIPPIPPMVGPTLPLSGYTGVYSNNLYGNINITTKNNTLICYYGNNTTPLELKHWNDDTFEEPVNSNFIVFADIHDGKAHLLNTSVPDYSTVPASTDSVFNRTNSTTEI